MKKNILLLSILSFVLVGVFGVVSWKVFSSNSVVVSATVGNVNAAPIVLSVTPTSTTVSVKHGTSKGFSLQIKDAEGDIIYYTITTPYGVVSPTSGSLTNSANLIAGTEYLNFSFLAPATLPGQIFNITVTLNDGPNLVTKNIAVFVF